MSAAQSFIARQLKSAIKAGNGKTVELSIELAEALHEALVSSKEIDAELNRLHFRLDVDSAARKREVSYGSDLIGKWVKVYQDNSGNGGWWTGTLRQLTPHYVILDSRVINRDMVTYIDHEAKK